MKQFIESLQANSILSFFKEYFSILLFIPTFLGGLRQLIQLVLISPNLIHFFSITQLLTDGILILLRVPIFLLGAFFYSFYNFLKTKGSNLKPFYLFGFISFIYLVSVIFYYYQQNDYHQFGRVVTLIFSNISVAFTYHHISKSNFKKHTKILFVLGASLLLSVVFDGADKKYDQLSIQNIDKISRIVNSKYPKTELRYYNDRYLIFEVFEKKKSKFVIKKFENLFENNNDE